MDHSDEDWVRLGAVKIRRPGALGQQDSTATRSTSGSSAETEAIGNLVVWKFPVSQKELLHSLSSRNPEVRMAARCSTSEMILLMRKLTYFENRGGANSPGYRPSSYSWVSGTLFLNGAISGVVVAPCHSWELSGSYLKSPYVGWALNNLQSQGLLEVSHTNYSINSKESVPSYELTDAGKEAGIVCASVIGSDTRLSRLAQTIDGTIAECAPRWAYEVADLVRSWYDSRLGGLLEDDEIARIRVVCEPCPHSDCGNEFTVFLGLQPRKTGRRLGVPNLFEVSSHDDALDSIYICPKCLRLIESGGQTNLLGFTL